MVSLWVFGIAEIVFWGSTEAARIRVFALDPSVGVEMVAPTLPLQGVI